MRQPPTLDPAVVSDFVNEGDEEALVQYLKDNFAIRKGPDGAPIIYEFDEKVVLSLQEILVKAKKKPTKIELFKAALYYVVNPKTRDFLVNHTAFIDDVTFNGNDADVQKAILKFFFNLTVNSKDTSKKLYTKFSPSILAALPQCVYEASALLYNISLHHPIDGLGIELYTKVLDLIESSDAKTEYLYFLIEQFLGYANFWPVYPELAVNQRIAVLETIRDVQIKGRKLIMAREGLEVLGERFANSSKIIFQTVSSSSEDLETHEPGLLLEVLDSLSSEEKYLKMLQDDRNFLINVGVVLINLHKLGKESDNCFSPIQKLSEIVESSDEIARHPAFGFKVNLVRIIGNLCYKNKRNQDLVREAELIPVFLDCANIDARNPLITEWIVFGIRNMCENNAENQAYIASVQRQGPVVDSTILNEMGLTLRSKDDGRSIKVVPLDTLKQHMEKIDINKQS